MPANTLIDRVSEIAKPYFPNLSLENLRNFLDQLPADEPVFAQVSQHEGKLQLEIGFRSGGVLVDLTHRADSWWETVVKFDNIDLFQFKKTASESGLVVRAEGSSVIRYTASADHSRVELEQYWRSLQRLLKR